MVWAVPDYPADATRDVPAPGSKWRRLQALVHGNRLIQAQMQTADKLPRRGLPPLQKMLYGGGTFRQN